MRIYVENSSSQTTLVLSAVCVAGGGARAVGCVQAPRWPLHCNLRRPRVAASERLVVCLAERDLRCGKRELHCQT